MKLVLILLAVLLAGCGADGVGNNIPDNGPALGAASVTVQAGSITLMGAGEKVDLVLVNSGQNGTFKLEFWGLPTSPNGPNTFYGETEPYGITAEWEGSAAWIVGTGSGTSSKVRWVVVLTRNEDELQYRETDIYELARVSIL